MCLCCLCESGVYVPSSGLVLANRKLCLHSIKEWIWYNGHWSISIHTVKGYKIYNLQANWILNAISLWMVSDVGKLRRYNRQQKFLWQKSHRMMYMYSMFGLFVQCSQFLSFLFRFNRYECMMYDVWWCYMPIVMAILSSSNLFHSISISRYVFHFRNHTFTLKVISFFLWWNSISLIWSSSSNGQWPNIRIENRQSIVIKWFHPSHFFFLFRLQTWMDQMECVKWSNYEEHYWISEVVKNGFP